MASSSLREACVVLVGLMAALCPLIQGRGQDMRATLQRAEELAQTGKREESIRLFRQMLQSEPQCWQAYVGIGRNHFAAGEYVDAAAAFQKAFELQPSDQELLNWLSRTYLLQHKPEKIAELLSHANSALADSATTHLLLARAYEAQDKLEEARREIGVALRIDPRCHGAHFAQGFIDWSTGELSNAETELRHELDLDPREDLAAYYLGEVLEKQGKLTEAERVLAQMGRAHSNTYLYQLAVGKLYEREKNNPLAVEHYRTAIRLDAQQSEPHYRLAITLRALGETASANQEVQIFSELESHTAKGMGQGMGRMRPHLPDFN
jgi:tetratricopeptide (TPR) repeat protein